MGACGEAHTTLEINVHHDVALSTVTNKTGTIVLNYDVSSFYDKLNASSMTISLGTTNIATLGINQVIMNVTSGTDDSVNSGAGIFNLPCCESGLRGTGNNAVSANSNGDSADTQIKFLLTHPSTTMAAGVFPIAVDFFNFNSSSGIADAIYRLEAEEDGTDGVFTGTVDYATMVHEGNSTNATNVIVTNSDEITLLLAADATGTGAPRILYGDQDESNTQDIIGDQLDAVSYTHLTLPTNREV